MTHIRAGSTRYEVLCNQHTMEISEKIGYDITGKEFVGGAYENGIMRGYVLMPLLGTATMKRGPVNLNFEDVVIVTYK